MAIGNNVYYDDTDNRYEFMIADEASFYLQQDGKHIFSSTAAGAADGAITWTTQMSISQAGIITALPTYNSAITSNVRDLQIDDSGVIGYVVSSRRYKTDIQDLGDTSWIYNLRPVDYVYKSDPTGTVQWGLIAEEVEQVQPKLVSYARRQNPDGTYYTDYTTPETVSYNQLITPLLKELQIQNQKLNQLEQDLLGTTTLTLEQINSPATKDLVLAPSSGKVVVQGSIEVNGDIVTSGEIAGASIKLGDQAAGQAIVPAGEDKVFVSSTLVKATDKIIISPIYTASGVLSETVQLFRGAIEEGQGFWVNAVPEKPLTGDLSFDWLIVK